MKLKAHSCRGKGVCRSGRICFDAGQEYEAILCEKLRNAGIPFFSESFLREQGFFKTPDIKLQVDICTC